MVRSHILGAGIIFVMFIIGALYFFVLTGILTPSLKIYTSNVTSDIFVVNGTTGNDGGVDQLLRLMEREGTPFYMVRSGTPNRD